MDSKSSQDAPPPPSYEEAIKDSHTPAPPPRPTRPAMATPSPATSNPSPSLNSRPPQSNNSNQNDGTLYTTNPNLPFKYPRGHFCQKCKNSGFKLKNGKACRDCWSKFYLQNNSYNPNPQLPYRYPKGYLCDKCNNTGHKLKNGLSCQNCYELFSPRNKSSYSSSVPFMSSTSSGFGFVDNILGGSRANLVSTTFNSYGTNTMSTTSSGPLRVLPGDPRIGGILCGRCRGSGQVTFLFDNDLCNVCGGTGRILTQHPPHPPPMHHPPPPNFNRPPPQNPYYNIPGQWKN
ncbi:hypothetical protein HYPBUDRAFT_148245 [Hyphopichia burtonii NRRL Y-1933]|uniref:Uncharacterized protein n=1 Tax=Hyphopichia burtonii NRRL Y-1933 TaxID=984485 RepID=A0A1E4RKZ8_9ASCO|nr:hypothetical protein HYPBUDRAFT_148245 [Hyphopichia burtonii NRRL Y-1933]ODV67947.1 hypothetical protein HYPBUDRAFT_148245 [Hyphopichia burtonii NRRL Y-1933]